MKTFTLIAAAMLAVVVVAGLVGPVWMQVIAGVIVSPFIAIALSLLGAPFLRDQLTHDPSLPNPKNGMFIGVQPGRAVQMMKGDEPAYIIYGDRADAREFASNNKAPFWLWGLYQRYVLNFFGIHPYIPFIYGPFVYGVPRIEICRNDDDTYREITEGDPRYYTNHVRTKPFVWHFVFDGVEIQKLPFTVTGVINLRIVPGKIHQALFDVEPWPEFVNEAIKAVVRNYMRSHISLDDILGSVEQDIWEPMKKNLGEKGQPILDQFSYEIKQFLRQYKLTPRIEPDQEGTAGPHGISLIELGIDIQRFDITDFQPEFDASSIQGAAIGREEGRRRSLEGQGVAEAQKKLVDAHSDSKASLAIIENRAFVEAVKGSSVLDVAIGRYASPSNRRKD